MESEKRKKKKPRSLNKRLLVFLILCWVVPVVVFFAFTTISYQRGIIEKSERMMEDELANVAAFASIRIGEDISLCQRPSYEKTWENALVSYELGNISRSDYLRKVYNSLKEKFYLDNRFNLFAYYGDSYDTPSCYSSRTAVSVQSYMEEVQPGLEDIMKADSSYTYVKVIKGRIFVIRNLYTTLNYRRYGTLVVELNRDQVFRDVPVDIRNDMVVCFSEPNALINYVEETKEEGRIELMGELQTKYDGKSDNKLDRAENKIYNGYLYQKKCDNYHIGVMLFVKKSEIYAGLYELYTIVGIMLLLFLPVFCYGIHFLRRQIQIPVRRMVNASQKIEEGEIGLTVGGGQMPNMEFQYLMESFNSMSQQVKYLFDYVYDEKLARKDAQIQALQAQINPHFLNNTLEMMNWQARMSGDIVVSKMIEALGTVLDYRMNRANVKEIHLAEELQCTDAYFYIMSMRFGQRLQIEKEIDDTLLYIMVPPLILQPIVENAIVHGVESMKNGAIRMKIYHDAENVYLQVRNTGKEMTKEDKERIQAILEGDEENIPKVQGRHTSIGIRNVNRRIKLVYGENYGLTIEQNEENVTISTITLPFRAHEMPGSLKERSEVESELRNMARLNK